MPSNAGARFLARNKIRIDVNPRAARPRFVGVSPAGQKILSKIAEELPLPKPPHDEEVEACEAWLRVGFKKKS